MTALAGIFPLVLLGGCDLLGPNSIRMSRANYNSAVQQTSKEQLLLNVVRLRYSDPPLFFDVTSVASQFSIQGIAGSSNSFTRGGVWSTAPGVSASISETPTITYVPLQGDNLVKQMMSPISLEVIASLYRAGWDVRTLLALCVDRFGTELSDPPMGGGNGRFDLVIGEFRSLQEEGALDVAVRKGDIRPGGQPIGPDELIFIIDPNAAPVERRDAVIASQGRLRALLPVESATSRPAETRPTTQASHAKPEDGASFDETAIQQFTFHEHHGARGSQRATVDSPALRTRSVLGAMSYVAQGVEVPRADRASAAQISGAIRQPLIYVHSARSAPEDAYVSVPYRGQWFYVDDRDARTKASFMLLFEVMGAQASGLQNTGLLLTLPVTRQ